MFQTVEELVKEANSQNLPLSEVMIQTEIETTGKNRAEIIEKMSSQLTVMEKAVQRGLHEEIKSRSGLSGGDARLLKHYIEHNESLSGSVVLDAVSKAMATNEVNAAMGTICATPTAGSAGVVPGVLFGLQPKLNPTRDQMIAFLFTAGAFGFVVANNASISGAAGGCQAEVGSATGMAAAAAVEMAGGTAEQSAHAMAIALGNLLGLICDPVAGLVEAPCVKRNAIGASSALVAADLALAGIKSVIPCDEVIDAMYRVGRMMPTALRETALGGLADTKTGRALKERIFGINAKRSVPKE
ncbi:L-serine ammonia-lyase, iron-sulfur-dependent, subunit alpha [Sporolactobacillus terrae]|uniref:L-serine dehydratase n=1 Tax=Sporolactobacillus terrae TaxID=269673 RepID=A0ABX5Q6N9_9BACL|nr:L-serine ammonia-lyase, iron-sulfur-dependent, subunit alpha [Sporolactobacillus terrae]QAA22310.1 L-serine ammonia-lyase, iron-sulfur-dependent, subunit alpha [Sporolactobacillus terrae]QAA25286.1 L-serine ammonia-lyase, iron-sulfur-dependent, subunit alpha [Sporolactobacillus terrae]UAK17099.1 L-serine ammonia-lyase, iron-sulfur-dependent, subunit alpha [Sporolactobacillus terrae]